jgi:four helix bundle protein
MNKTQENNRPYDLEERLARFSGEFIDFVRTIPIDAINRRIIEQSTGSFGSAGANYCEATEAESKKDFLHKIGIVRKELKETKHWLRLLARANPERKNQVEKFRQEAHELLLIFAKISRSSRNLEIA